MIHLEKSKTDFLNSLQELRIKFEENDLQATIGKNILEIFEKMFIHYYSTEASQSPVSLRKEAITNSFHAFLQERLDIWSKKSEVDRKFGKHQEAEKEEIKVKVAREISVSFSRTFASGKTGETK